MAGFGAADVFLGVVSVTMKVKAEVTDDVTKGEKVADEEEGSKNRALRDPLIDWRGHG